MSKKGLYLLWEQGVEGSNPFAPTIEKQGVTKDCSSYFCFKNVTRSQT